MNTYLGASVDLEPEDVDEALIAGAQVTYLEGYLWDRPRAKEAFRKAARIARAGRKVALTLSDPFCVERHRAEFQELVRARSTSFSPTRRRSALWKSRIRPRSPPRAGSSRWLPDAQRTGLGGALERDGSVPAEPVQRVVDTTGAGDLFAAGFLYGSAARPPAEPRASGRSRRPR